MPLLVRGLILLSPVLSDYTMLNFRDRVRKSLECLCMWSVVGMDGSFGNVTDLMDMKTPPTCFVNTRSQQLHESMLYLLISQVLQGEGRIQLMHFLELELILDTLECPPSHTHPLKKHFGLCVITVLP